MIKPTLSLDPGTVKSVLVLGAGAAGLQCSRLLREKGCNVTILEARDRIGGRLITDENGVDLGAHWIHGGGPDKGVPDWQVDSKLVNPVRLLCDKFGIQTKLTDGDSSYIGESEVGLSEISFYLPDGSLMPQDGEAEDDLWATYELVMHKVHELEEQMRESGKEEGNMSLADAITKVKSGLDPPLTKRQEQYLQWHLETELGGDYGEDAEALSFWNYDGGSAGEYRVFVGGDRVLVGGYSALVDKLAEPVRDCVQLGKIVTKITRSAGGVKVGCADGSTHAADVVVVTLPLGVLKRQPGAVGHVEMVPPLPEWKRESITRGHMACLNKLVLFFDKCYWPSEQYTFAYINKIANEFPSMIVNLWPSHAMPALVILVGGTAGRTLERRKLRDNVAWSMRLVRKLFGKRVPKPTKALQTAWGQDPFSFGSYSCAGKGIHGDDMTKMSEPVDGKLFFAGEHTCPTFWGCVHGALVSGTREAGRILADKSLLSTKMLTTNKRAAKMQNVATARRLRSLKVQAELACMSKS